ncbi:cell division protein DivIVA, partial [Bacillus anthracis]
AEPLEEVAIEKNIELSSKNIEELEEVYTEDMDEIKSFFAKN